MYPLPEITVALVEQPVEWVDVVCGIGFRVVVLEKAGHVIPQHHHDGYPHATFCGAGRARLWVNGKYAADLEKGRAIEIKAGDEHLWQALEDGTLLACISDAARAEKTKGGS